MRRGTLIMVVVLVLLILGAALFQLLFVRGDGRRPPPATAPAGAPER